VAQDSRASLRGWSGHPGPRPGAGEDRRSPWKSASGGLELAHDPELGGMRIVVMGALIEHVGAGCVEISGRHGLGEIPGLPPPWPKEARPAFHSLDHITQPNARREPHQDMHVIGCISDRDDFTFDQAHRLAQLVVQHGIMLECDGVAPPCRCPDDVNEDSRWRAATHAPNRSNVRRSCELATPGQGPGDRRWIALEVRLRRTRDVLGFANVFVASPPEPGVAKDSRAHIRGSSERFMGHPRSRPGAHEDRR